MFNLTLNTLNSSSSNLGGEVLVVILLIVLAIALFIFITIEICSAASLIRAKRNPESAPQKSSFWKRFLVYLVIVLIILYGAQAIDCITNSTNKDNWINPFTRTAREDDVTVNQSLEFNLSDNYTVTACYDIKDLEITIYFLDNSNNVISAKSKAIGDVKADLVYNFSFSLNEFTASEILTIRRWKSEVTGGSISYFAKGT